MTMVREIVAEIIGMFIGDAWLTVAILAVVGAAAAMLQFGADPVGVGGFLLFGCLFVLIGSIWRGAWPKVRD